MAWIKNAQVLCISKLRYLRSTKLGVRQAAYTQSRAGLALGSSHLVKYMRDGLFLGLCGRIQPMRMVLNIVPL